jgi:hypothetical protein
MKRIGVVLAVVVLHQVHAEPAAACGAVPYLLSLLLPLEDATTVGVDAALIASVNMGGAFDFELRKADELDEDAGADGVELDVECEAAEGSKVCIAKPTTLLEPNTNYVWRLKSEGYQQVSPWRAFATTDVASPVGETQIDAQVVSEHRTENVCGDYYTVDLAIQVGELRGPTVLHVPGRWINLFEAQVLLTEGNVKTELRVLWPPPCFDIELVDATGQRNRVAALCTPSAHLDGGVDGSTSTDQSDGVDTKSATTSDEISDTKQDGGSGGRDDDGPLRGISQTRNGCTIAATSGTKTTSGSQGTLGWLSALGIAVGTVLRRRVKHRVTAAGT